MARPRVRRTRRHQRHRERVMRAHNGVCHLCGHDAADAIDHIVPVSRGGSDDPSNLAPAHTSCNTAKSDAAPPQWTYSRPAMWLPGYGPRAPNSADSSGASGRLGCWSIGGAILVALLVGGLVGSLVASEWVGLAVTAAVAWALISWLQKRSRAAKSGTSVGSSRLPMQDEPVSLTMPDGRQIRNARGTAAMGGTAADVPHEGEDMVWLGITIQGDNIETLIGLLQLSPGDTGYRDAMLQPDGDLLIVNALARLAADAAASGDDDVTAAPIGHLSGVQWRSHPGLGGGLTLVQVAITVNRDGSRSARIGFSSDINE
ncbi:MAG: HNH endonuclease [Actinobacteria bacterium]|nr:HNH endonuclease [Actinomycetota bacterium]